MLDLQATSSRAWVDRCLIIIIILWPLVVLGAMVASYVGRPFTEVLSFNVVDGWCDTSSDGIGSHCFGDFGLPFYQGGSPGQMPSDGYTDGNINGTNTPLVVLAFQVLNSLSYRFLLAVAALAYAGSMAIFMLWASRGLPSLQRTALVIFGGVLCVGLIVALDRSNHVALMGPLLGLLLLAPRPWQRVIAMTLLICLKFWGVVFILVMLRRRQYREACISLVVALFVNLVSLLIATDNMFRAFGNMLQMATSREVADMVAPYSISAVGLLRNASCALGVDELCPVSEAQSRGMVLALSVIVVILLLGLSWVAMGRTQWSPLARFSPLICIVVLGLPEAGVYVLVLIPVLTAVLAHDAGRNARSPGEPRWLTWATLVAIGATTVPLPLWWSVPVDQSDFLIRWPYLASPILWSGVMILTLVAMRVGAATDVKKERSLAISG